MAPRYRSQITFYKGAYENTSKTYYIDVIILYTHGKTFFATALITNRAASHVSHESALFGFLRFSNICMGNKAHISKVQLTWLVVESQSLTATAIDGSKARHCTAIVTNERARLRQSVKFFGQSREFKNTIGRWYNCEITVHPRKLQHRHYYFNREAPYWLQFSITVAL